MIRADYVIGLDVHHAVDQHSQQIALAAAHDVHRKLVGVEITHDLDHRHIKTFARLEIAQPVDVNAVHISLDVIHIFVGRHSLEGDRLTVALALVEIERDVMSVNAVENVLRGLTSSGRRPMRRIVEIAVDVKHPLEIIRRGLAQQSPVEIENRNPILNRDKIFGALIGNVLDVIDQRRLRLGVRLPIFEFALLVDADRSELRAGRRLSALNVGGHNPEGHQSRECCRQ